MVNFIGKMAKFIRVNGKMVNNMVKEKFRIQVDKSNMENGKMERKFDLIKIIYKIIIDCSCILNMMFDVFILTIYILYNSIKENYF